MLTVDISLKSGERIKKDVIGVQVLHYGFSFSEDQKLGDGIGDSRTFFWEQIEDVRVYIKPGEKQVKNSKDFQTLNTGDLRRLV